jgi:pimeloyl-ACP methyl ester carboxylesterase
VSDDALPPGGRLLPVEGVTLYVEEHGTGDPVVLLHNFTNSGAGWAFLVPGLASRYRVLVVDLPGHGRSTGWEDRCFDYAGAARRVLGALDRLAVGRCRLVGASTGGAVALRMAAAQPERVDALVVLGSFDRITDEAVAILSKPGQEELTADEMAEQRRRHAHGDDQIRALQRMFCNERENPQLRTAPPLGRITARTLIIHGDHDKFFPPRVAVAMYDAIPQAYLWVVPDGGHLPGFDGREPAAVAAAIRSFLGGDWEPRY